MRRRRISSTRKLSRASKFEDQCVGREGNFIFGGVSEDEDVFPSMPDVRRGIYGGFLFSIRCIRRALPAGAAQRVREREMSDSYKAERFYEVDLVPVRIGMCCSCKSNCGGTRGA